MRFIIAFTAFLFCGIPFSFGQTTVAPSPVPTVAVIAATPIATSDLASSAEEVTNAVTEIESSISDSSDLDRIRLQMVNLKKTIDERVAEVNQTSNTKVLQTFQDQESELKKENDEISRSINEVSEQAKKMETALTYVSESQVTWEKTLDAQKAGTVGPDTVARIRTVLDLLKKTADEIRQKNGLIVTLQIQLSDQSSRIAGALRVIRQAREQTVLSLLERDTNPLWDFDPRPSEEIQNVALDSFSDQYKQLSNYTAKHVFGFVIIGILFLGLLSLVQKAKSKLDKFVSEDAGLEPTVRIFQASTSMASLITIFIVAVVAPQAPQLLWTIIGVVALVPTILIIRRVADERLYPVFNALIFFYAIDQIRFLFSSLVSFSRMLLLTEMLLALVLLQLFTRSRAWKALCADKKKTVPWYVIFSIQAISCIVLLAFLSNILGYGNLSELLANAAFKSAYIAASLYAIGKIVFSLIVFSFRVPPLQYFNVIQAHRLLLLSRTRFVLSCIIGITWLLFMLDAVSLKTIVLTSLGNLLQAEIGYGSISFTLENILAFSITVLVAVYLSRFIRFVLEEEIYPRTSLGRGLPYAISRVIHYIVLLFGFFLAIGALGLDMTKFTILAGAFGVGLGFGLQNILNNFFSGLIVLFERPVRVGDVIQMGDVEGIVEKIGIRASFIRTNHGSELIVPNARLISDQVTNWTFSNRQRAIEIPVMVTLDSDLEKTSMLMKQVALDHPLITKDPAPEVLVTKFGAEALSLELSAVTNHSTEWAKIRSELIIALQRVFAANTIVVK